MLRSLRLPPGELYAAFFMLRANDTEKTKRESEKTTIDRNGMPWACLCVGALATRCLAF
jgi:hypothetical protein